MISQLSHTKYHVKSIFFLILFLVSTSYSRNLKPISLKTIWKYDVSFSNPVYRGKFSEKIDIHQIAGRTININNMALDEKSIDILEKYAGRHLSTRLSKIFTVTDSIFMQVLDSSTIPCPGVTARYPSNPMISVFQGSIIETDSLRIKIINGYLTCIIPVTYDSGSKIFVSKRNYFSENCENINIFEFNRKIDEYTDEIEFTGMITTEWTHSATVDSNGIQSLFLPDYSNVQPCNSNGMSIKLDTNKLVVRYGIKKYLPSLTTSTNKITNFLLNGRVFSTTGINSSRIELTNSGIRTVKLP